MLSNLIKMTNFDLSNEKYTDLRAEYEEYLSVRSAKFLSAKYDAEKLLKSIDTLFPPAILERTAYITSILNKQN